VGDEKKAAGKTASILRKKRGPLRGKSILQLRKENTPFKRKAHQKNTTQKDARKCL